MRLRQSIAMPTNVFTRDTASAPASAAACAIGTILVTFGVNFAMIGNGQTLRTPVTIRWVAAGSVAKSSPPETFGHDRFNSSPASPGSLPIFAAMSMNSLSVLPAMFAIIAVGSVRRYGR